MSDRRLARRRGANPYNKPALTEAELLARWQDRGLIIPDRHRASRYIRHIGYYRLSAYVRSFETSERDVLRPGTSFDDVLNLYIFDRKLRLIVLDPLERIEVAVRAAMGDHMALADGPHWYERAGHFARKDVHRKLLDEVDSMVEGQLRRRPEHAEAEGTFVSAMEHYVTRYATPRRPPTWLIFEELSFGMVRNVYDALTDRSRRTMIARSLGLEEPVLSSWLLSYQRVRNISAHHGRLWNRGLGVNPVIPKSRSIRWLEDRELFVRDEWRRQRLYPVLVSLQTVLHTISPGSRWDWRLHDLLTDHPHVPLSGMGIPHDWHDDPFWPKRPR